MNYTNHDADIEEDSNVYEVYDEKQEYEDEAEDDSLIAGSKSVIKSMAVEFMNMMETELVDVGGKMIKKGSKKYGKKLMKTLGLKKKTPLDKASDILKDIRKASRKK